MSDSVGDFVLIMGPATLFIIGLGRPEVIEASLAPAAVILVSVELVTWLKGSADPFD